MLYCMLRSESLSTVPHRRADLTGEKRETVVGRQRRRPWWTVPEVSRTRHPAGRGDGRSAHVAQRRDRVQARSAQPREPSSAGSVRGQGSPAAAGSAGWWLRRSGGTTPHRPPAPCCALLARLRASARISTAPAPGLATRLAPGGRIRVRPTPDALPPRSQPSSRGRGAREPRVSAPPTAAAPAGIVLGAGASPRHEALALRCDPCVSLAPLATRAAGGPSPGRRPALGSGPEGHADPARESPPTGG